MILQITTNEFGLYAQIAVTGICAIAYFLIFRYQSQQLKLIKESFNALRSHIGGQSAIISDFEKYKAILNVDDFKKQLDLKLEIQKDELQKEYGKREKEIANETFQAARKSIEETVLKSVEDIFMRVSVGWEELSQIAISVTLKQFPTKEDKSERDAYIQRSYPKNAEYFIGFCDAFIDGRIK